MSLSCASLAQAVLALLMVQLGLGFAAYLSRLQWQSLRGAAAQHHGVHAPWRTWPGVRWCWRPTVVLAIQTRRMIAVRAEAPSAQKAHGKAVIA